VLVDVRAYRVRPGKLPQELDLYAKHGLAAQIRHLGAPLAYLTRKAATSTRSCISGRSRTRLIVPADAPR
jgi:hypothetical protein